MTLGIFCTASFALFLFLFCFKGHSQLFLIEIKMLVSSTSWFNKIIQFFATTTNRIIEIYLYSRTFFRKANFFWIKLFYFHKNDQLNCFRGRSIFVQNKFCIEIKDKTIWIFILYGIDLLIRTKYLIIKLLITLLSSPEITVHVDVCFS